MEIVVVLVELSQVCKRTRDVFEQGRLETVTVVLVALLTLDRRVARSILCFHSDRRRGWTCQCEDVVRRGVQVPGKREGVSG